MEYDAQVHGVVDSEGFPACAFCGERPPRRRMAPFCCRRCRRAGLRMLAQLPSPAEIAERAARIRATWVPAGRAVRNPLFVVRSQRREARVLAAAVARQRNLASGAEAACQDGRE